MANQSVELLPSEAPVRESAAVPLEQVVFTALENRAEIKEAMKRARLPVFNVTSVRMNCFPSYHCYWELTRVR